MATKLIYTERAIDKVGQEYIDIIKKLLIEDDNVATGRLIRSLRYDVVVNVNKISLRIFAEKYLETLDKGRKANGKFPNMVEIGIWRRARRIEPDGRPGGARTIKQLNYLLARSISRTDRPGTNILRRAQDILMNNVKVIKDIYSSSKIDIEATIQKALGEIQKEFNK